MYYEKTIFMAALGVAGMMSATVNSNVNLDLEKKVETSVQVDLVTVAPPEHAWIGIETWCGKVFFLDMNHYSSFEDMDAAADHFTDAQCGKQSTGIGPGFV